MDTIGIPIHWGYEGVAKRLYRQYADAVYRRHVHADARFKAFLVNVERCNGDDMAYQSQIFVVPRFNGFTPRLGRGPQQEVASLSTLPPASAVKPAGGLFEWNDLRDEVGNNVGV